nr:putative late blight resistance protein homolog R1C-3 isoform X1 [Ipomoea batatas]
MSKDDTDEVLLEILMKKCKDEQSWVDTAEALRMALRGKCKGHKIRDDTTEVLYESLIKMSEDDNSWKKISSTLRESIKEKWENTKNWDDIAKPLYDSLIVNFEDNNEMSPKFPVERHKDIKMWEDITSVISQSKIVDKKDIRRTDDEVRNLFKSLQDLAELKVSKENVGPPELKEFGRQIAERCGGVPLVVVLVAGILQKKIEEKYFSWKTDSEQTSPHSELTSTYDRFCLLKRNDKYLSPDSATSLNPSLGTLLCFSSHNPNLGTHSLFASEVDPSSSSGLWVASTFKLVRVLDLESVFVGKSFLSMVEFLLCLRYLAVCLKGWGSVPQPSLERLHHLETFKVKSSVDLHLSSMIWNLEGLRHLHIDHYCHWCLYYGGNFFRIPPKPLNLQTFSVPILFASRTDELLLRKLPHLQKLRCRFSTSWYRNCHRFPELGFLDQLESLEACTSDHLSAPISSVFDFPPSLKELILHKFRLPWDSISVIAKLPRLESLELFSAFDGEQWDVEEGNFRKLKFLRICESRIVRWNATAESFPKLERLVLTKCRHLEEVPSDFQDIITLQVIEIDQCNSSVARSVKKIQEEMEALGNENLNVRVLHSDLELGTCK